MARRWKPEFTIPTRTVNSDSYIDVLTGTEGKVRFHLYRWPDFDEARDVLKHIAAAFQRRDLTVQVVPPAKKHRPPHIGQKTLF